MIPGPIKALTREKRPTSFSNNVRKHEPGTACGAAEGGWTGRFGQCIRGDHSAFCRRHGTFGGSSSSSGQKNLDWSGDVHVLSSLVPARGSKGVEVAETALSPSSLVGRGLARGCSRVFFPQYGFRQLAACVARARVKLIFSSDVDAYLLGLTRCLIRTQGREGASFHRYLRSRRLRQVDHHRSPALRARR